MTPAPASMHALAQLRRWLHLPTRFWRRAWLAGLTLAALLPWCGTLQAAQLVAIVSERSASEVLAGARAFRASYPEHQVALRTVAQLRGQPDAQVAGLWKSADALLIAAVFRDDATRLLELLKESPLPPETPLVALNGDVRLTRLTRIEGALSFASLDETARRELLLGLGSHPDPLAHGRRLAEKYPSARRWLEARAYWNGRGRENLSGLLSWLVQRSGARDVEPPAPLPPRLLELELDGETITPDDLGRHAGSPVVAVLDYESGLAPQRVHAPLCEALERRALRCLLVRAKWGEPSVRGLRALAAAARALPLSAVVSLQAFVIGGGGARQQADRALLELGVPVFNALALHERSEAEWRQSSDGVPYDSLHYRIAMPELQGIGQPTVVAVSGPAVRDNDTGLQHESLAPLEAEIDQLGRRIARWHALQTTPNAKKRVAIVYYNHPPGRHNVGADNLDVPESLLDVLRLLSKAGYAVRDVPETSGALVDRIQDRGVNLPESGPELARMAELVPTLSSTDYSRWFRGLPSGIRTQVVHGPLGALLDGRDRIASDGKAEALYRARSQNTLSDVQHLLEGVRHPARERALNLLGQLRTRLDSGPLRPEALRKAKELAGALERTGIEGLRGWGEPPGAVMVHQRSLVLPSIEFGNVVIGPQPPRGWELDEELLHANLAFAPPHQYLAYYHWLRDVWRADVVVHLGRHSTYEFLPGHRAGLPLDDAPRIVLGDLPSVYVYIVDGVGEGIQAKRRGQAVIVDHLTPPLSTTPLYDQLLELRQLVESHEVRAGADPAHLQAATRRMRRLIGELHLEQALAASMQSELEVRGISFDQVDDELLVHEVGHYLTKLQERFMPFGLHVFGRDWKAEALDTMLNSMRGDRATAADLRQSLADSPRAERDALLDALRGRFVPPGPGNDPVRTPEALPTGRNFHALDHSLLPTRLSYELGAKLARDALEADEVGAQAVVLWASDTVRDEGAMVSFGLALLGVAPTWNSRGIVSGIERLPLGEAEGGPARVRRDTTFVTSGLFRDLYGHLLELLDSAVLLALDGASHTIALEHPELSAALESALAPLGVARQPGSESLEQNQVAQHWVLETLSSLKAGKAPALAGREATYRVFGNAKGGYGAGINRLAERSGSWTSRDELAAAYLRRMGHAYGKGLDGKPAHAVLERRLAQIEDTYLGRASNLYGLLDNNDGFDYLGGLGMAVEKARGKPPRGRVVLHADPSAARLESLPEALFSELRGRHLNPAYLQALMQHGYAGARTMGSEFLENLWGWQVTSPEVVQPWVWDETRRVFFDDGYGIGLADFLEQGANVHVKTNALALHLVAAQKGFWEPGDEVLRRLATDFVELVAEHGLPGSGHTRPDHPVLSFAQELAPASAQRDRFAEVVSQARRPVRPPTDPSIAAEIEASRSPATPDEIGGRAGGVPWALLAMGFGAAALLGWGVRSGLGLGLARRRSPRAGRGSDV